MTPFVKWAGGKKQILPLIIDKINSLHCDEDTTFYEPFVGGGIVFLSLGLKNVVINDMNTELINTYKVIKDDPFGLIDILDRHKKRYLDSPLYYYEVRKWDRPLSSLLGKTEVERAARMIFLNKTCYNGLYRVNSRGEFNTPVGKYVNPSLYSKKNIEDISKYLNNCNITILNGDYKRALRKVKYGDIIYLDPPYHYENENGFTLYQKEGFSFEDFIELKKECDRCIDREASVIISNNETKKVLELFKKDPKYTIYNIDKINTKRSINSNKSARKSGKEVLIMGLPTVFPQANNFESIIKLILVEKTDYLKDSDKIMSILDYETLRQSHYYLASLRYLEIIDDHKEFSEFGLDLRNSNIEILKEKLARKILEKEVFKIVYEHENFNKQMDTKDIAVLLNEFYGRKYSVSTIQRRASTIRRWIDWCIDVLN